MPVPLMVPASASIKESRRHRDLRGRSVAIARSALWMLFAVSASAVADIGPPRVTWAIQTDGPVRGAPVVSGDTVYVGSADGFVYAADKTSGELRWKAPVGGAVAGAVAIAGDLVITSGRGRIVSGLASQDGQVRWTFETGPVAQRTNEWSYYTAAPVVAGDQVLVPSVDGVLYALDTSTGKPRWSFRTGDSLLASPLVRDGVVYQPSGDDHVYALSARDGKLLWKFATAGVQYDLSQGFTRSDIFTRPSLAAGLLVFGSRDANVYAVDVRTRRKKWTFAYDSTWAMSSVVDGNRVFVGWSTNNRINALDLATGKQVWEFDAGSHTYTTGLVIDDVVVFASANGKVRALGKSDGKPRWEYDLGVALYSSPVHEAGTLFLGTDDGRLIRLDPRGAEPARAVYLPAKVPQNIAGFVVDPAIAPALEKRGYTRLDGPASLADWLRGRLENEAPAVLVFAFAQIPPAVIGEEPATGPLRRFLDAGGKVVWPWGIPNKYLFDDAGQFVSNDPGVAERMLGLDFVDFEDSGNYFARATQAGRNWGLPAWLKTSFAYLATSEQVTPLTTDELGRVGAFVRRFHPRPGSGWVSFAPNGFGVPISDAELGMLERVAEYGLR